MLLNKLDKIFNAIFAIFFIYIIISLSITYGSYCTKNLSLNIPLTVILILIIALAGFAIFALLKKGEAKFKIYLYKKDEKEKICRNIFCILFLILMISQLIIAIYSGFKPRNDLKHLCDIAQNVILYGKDKMYYGINKEHQNYLSVYPNNHMVYMYIYLLYKFEYSLTGHFSNFLPILFNILSLDIAYFLTYKCAKLIYDPSKAIFCAIRAFLFTPIITYACIFYSDSLSMPWISASIYFYIKQHKMECIEKKGKIKKYGIFILSILTICIAYKIKGSAIIFLAAMAIDMIIIRIKKNGIRQTFSYFISALVLFAVCSLLISSVLCNTIGITKKSLDRYSFPVEHWVMMTATGEGGYHLKDVQYTKSFDTKEKKKEADIERLKYKLESQSTKEFAIHIIKKTTHLWMGGTYMTDYYYRKFSLFKSNIYLIFTIIFHYAVLFFIASSFIEGLRRKNDVFSDTCVLRLTLVGIIFFFLLWESRNRYIIDFFTLFTLI